MSSSADGLVDYTSNLTDNLRWGRFHFRADDIVVAAPAKSGTTWTQLVVSLLLFGDDVPGPIAEISPWLDMTLRSEEVVFDTLARQEHRRFFKTHTPLDGVAYDPSVRYICVARDPRDAAISFVHHFNNLDYGRLREIAAQMGGTYEPTDDTPDRHPVDWILRGWVTPGAEEVWPLQGLIHQLRTYWERRDLPNVELFHFADYRRDLPGEVERIARFIGIPLDRPSAEQVAARASIDAARDRAHTLAPDAHLDGWKDSSAFFRSGERGQWREFLSDTEISRYEQRIADMVPPDLAAWIHDGWGGPPI